MQIPLLVALWEHPNFKGRKRVLVEDCPNLAWQAFDDKVSAVGVHPGPDYLAWKAGHPGSEPTVALYEHHKYGGRFIILSTGAYSDLWLMFEDGFGGEGFHDRVTSVKFNPSRPVFESDLQQPYFLGRATAGTTETRLPPPFQGAHPIDRVPLVVEVYKHPDFITDYLVIAENTSSITGDFGGDFNDSISSVRVLEGSGWSGENVQLFPHPDYKGNPLVLGLGHYPRLQAWGYNDNISSVRVVP